uniref:glycogenin glucosyltransferase n=1 Tax=Romanomermis culicivorax TaxID=13658 RepID=A0A915J8T9_ROMCU
MADKRAWVTLALNNDYAISAMVLAQSLRNHASKGILHVLTTWHVSEALRENLHEVFDRVTVIDPDAVSNQVFDRCGGVKRPDLAAIFTKFQCWRLIDYGKCIFLDADCLIIKNCDELFDREEFSAAPDVRWPDIFNSSIFVFSPSNETYDSLVDFAIKHGSFDDIKILNFAGEVKPWHYKYNFVSGNFVNQRGGYFNIEHVRLWWNIFLARVMHRLYKIADTAGNRYGKYSFSNAMEYQNPNFLPMLSTGIN